MSPLIAIVVATCHFAGALPDRSAECTPGKADPAVTQANVGRTICVPGWSAKHRNVSQFTKRMVLRMYRVPGTGCGTRCEVDHLISIELGGTNDTENLWPEMYEPRPGAHEKDLVENHLRAEICAGRVTLSEAQREISTDWLSVYRRLTSAQRVKAAKSR